MKRSSHYRIYVIGSLPADLKERIASLHATALLKRTKEEVADDSKGLDEISGKAVEGKT